jgi:hypothetical protein
LDRQSPFVRRGEAVGLAPDYQVDWRFENGEIRERNVGAVENDFLELQDVDPLALVPKEGEITGESIVRAIRLDRERQK